MNTDLTKHTLSLLNQVERYASSSKQHAALENSRVTLHFIQGRGEVGEFEEFFESFDTAPLTPVLSFETKDDVDIWLRNHPAPPHGAIIGTADALYTVAYMREPDFRKLLRIPSKEELAQTGVDEDEADAAEEEAEPPNPSGGTGFRFFDFYRWSCFHLHAMEQRISSPEELEAIRTAKIAFDFVTHVGEEHGFEDFLQSLRAARTSRPLQSFATREAAESWLATQPEPPPPAVVAIGGELYSVGYNRRREVRVLIRIPMPRELDAGPPAAV
ncbi:hypothetical protein F0U59_13535 [Archangium gephyra]|nr:hypothetical protein F0U59_13535 [Archangium gephyra]